MENQISKEKSQMLKVLQNLDKPQKKIQKNSSSQNQKQKKLTNRRLMLRHQKIIHKENPLISLNPDSKSYSKETPIVAIDCEMVICEDQQYHLARISIVNYNRHVLFDSYIKPNLKIKNYLEKVTNLSSFIIDRAQSYQQCKDQIEKLLRDKIIIGHTIDKDIEQLDLKLNTKNLRDISEFSFYKNGKYKTSLKELSEKYLRLGIQGGVHSSVEDARATLELYKLYKKEIEREFKDNFLKSKNQLIINRIMFQPSFQNKKNQSKKQQEEKLKEFLKQAKNIKKGKTLQQKNTQKKKIVYYSLNSETKNQSNAKDETNDSFDLSIKQVQNQPDCIDKIFQYIFRLLECQINGVLL